MAETAHDPRGAERAHALVGGRGFAHTLQNTLNTVWAVPKVDRPGFFARYLRTLALLLLLGLIVVVTGAASTAAATATSLGLGGLPARMVSVAVGITSGEVEQVVSPGKASSTT